MILFLLLSSLLSFAAQNPDEVAYNQALDQANLEMIINDEAKSCPGTSLVISCGNGICEANKGEDVKTCAPDCIQGSIRSYNDQTICQKVQEIRIPETKSEVQDLVKEAISKGQKVKAVGALHSASETICTSGMVIPTFKLQKVIGISEVNGVPVVEAESGITVYELSEWLHEKGYALQGLPHMGFRDVSIGGSVATGSHGSTPNHAGVISNIVEAVEFIDGKGELHYVERSDQTQDKIRALSSNLGLLGIVTTLKLRVQPQFNLEVHVTYHKEKELFEENGILNVVKDCDYGQLNWFPGHGRFMKTCGIKSSKPVTPGINNELLNPKIPNFIVKPFKKVLQLGACSNTIMCLVETVRYWQFKLQPPFVDIARKNQFVSVGPAHRMVSSHLIKEQEGFFQMDWEIAVPKSRANEAMKGIREHLEKNKTCLPLVGMFIRYAPSESKSLLAHTFADGKDWKEGETAVFFEMPVYLPVGLSKERMKAYEKQYEDFARMLITKYSGRPHWGKNREWTFDLVLSQGAYQDSLKTFQQVVNEFDPNGTFSNDLSERLGLNYKSKEPKIMVTSKEDAF